MSDQTKNWLGQVMGSMPDLPMPPAKGTSDARSASLAGSDAKLTAEEWWTKLAVIIAEKMKLGGVELFTVKRNVERNTYEFEVSPESHPNAGGQRP